MLKPCYPSTIFLNHFKYSWRAYECIRTVKTTLKLKIKPKYMGHQHQRLPTKVDAKYRPSKTHRKPRDSSDSVLVRSNRIRYHPLSLLIGGTAVAYCAGYLAFLTVSLYKTPIDSIPIDASLQEDVSSRYDCIASSFDDTVESNEYWLGITSLRQKLVSQAQGDVLEVSIGTGRNLVFYDWDVEFHNGVAPNAHHRVKTGKVKSFTAIDASSEMLGIARKKLEKLNPGIKHIKWVLGDATATGTIPEPPRVYTRQSEGYQAKYDTIVQTMGLCSVKNPVALLQKLGEWIKEEDGKILLLEHGRGHWKWLNTMLDKSAKDHAQTFGCWWNRDLSKIVAESGLEVVKIKTPKWWHGGTTWWIELKKPNQSTKFPRVRVENESHSI